MNNDQISMLLAYMIQSQSSGGFVQNFLFPFLLSAISAMIGAYAAYYLLKRSELMAEERRKLNELNKLSIEAMDAFDQLASLKQHYAGGLDEDLYTRAAKVTSMFVVFKEFKISIEVISWLVSSQFARTANKWSESQRYMNLVSNYQHTLSVWEERNSEYIKCMSILLPEEVSGEFGDSRIESKLTKSQLRTWIDCTEHVLVQTDNMLIELHSLLNELPLLIKKTIKPMVYDKKAVISFKFDEFQTALLLRVPKADYIKATELFGLSISDLENRYKPRS